MSRLHSPRAAACLRQAAATGLVAAVVALPMAASGAATKGQPSIVRVSAPPGGTAPNRASFTPAISADGAWVAFASEASNLVPGDTNHHRDIFLRELATGRITRVSVSSSGQQSNGDSYNPSLSADGRYVVFDSFAANLVEGTVGRQGDVYLYDRDTRTTSVVSRGADGKPGDGQSGFPTISADASTVVFESTSHNLVPGVEGPASQVYAWDRRTGAFEVISKGYAGTPVSGGSGGVAVSADGRFVAFASASDQMVPNDFNQSRDVFLRDRRLQTTVRVSVNGAGGEGNARSDVPSISADGRYVSFESISSNLLGINPAAQNVPKVPKEADPTGRVDGADHNIASDVFVHDMLTGQTTRVSVASDGTEGVGDSYDAAMSADGHWVAFVSDAANIAPGDTNTFREVFLHDNRTGTTVRACAGLGGAQCDQPSTTPAIDADGGKLLFASDSTNVVPDDHNPVANIFLRTADQQGN